MFVLSQFRAFCLSRILGLIAVTALALLTGYTMSTAGAPQPIGPRSGLKTPSAQDASGDPWSTNQLIAPEEMAKLIMSRDKPLVLHIGVPVLFRNGHIPGSRYVGQTSTPSGREELSKLARDLPRNKEVFLYCGCCPWKDCPNIRPAFRVLQQMKFTKVRVLYLVNNFGEDWMKRGLPVEK